MNENFDRCCEFVVKGLEGKPTNDPHDPGGFTIWGLASAYNPEVTKDTTYEQAKQIYRAKYWGHDCTRAAWPLDLVFFDSRVNSQNDPNMEGVGNDELVKLLGNWEGRDPYRYAYSFLLCRAGRYARRSQDIYVRGHVRRVERLLRFIEGISLKGA
jgi:hypothetical protein